MCSRRRLLGRADRSADARWRWHNDGQLIGRCAGHGGQLMLIVMVGVVVTGAAGVTVRLVVMSLPVEVLNPA